MAVHHSDADRRRARHPGDLRDRLRRDRDAALELAAAAPVRVSRDHVAPGIRPAGAVPDAVWRVRWRRRWRTSFETDDTGGARTVAESLLSYACCGSGGYSDRQF